MNRLPSYGDLSGVPVKGHTREWFKKDIETIKNSIKHTFKMIPWLSLFTLLTNSSIYYLITFRFDLFEIITYSLIFWPIVVLGYFLLHIIKIKGYDIGRF